MKSASFTYHDTGHHTARACMQRVRWAVRGGGGGEEGSAKRRRTNIRRGFKADV